LFAALSIIPPLASGYGLVMWSSVLSLSYGMPSNRLIVGIWGFVPIPEIYPFLKFLNFPFLDRDYFFGTFQWE